MQSGSIAEEIKRRRTFAIISHPDAGKNDDNGKAPSFRWGNTAGRFCQGEEGRSSCNFRLDGNGEAARYIGNDLSHAVCA